MTVSRPARIFLAVAAAALVFGYFRFTDACFTEDYGALQAAENGILEILADGELTVDEQEQRVRKLITSVGPSLEPTVAWERGNFVIRLRHGDSYYMWTSKLREWKVYGE